MQQMEQGAKQDFDEFKNDITKESQKEGKQKKGKHKEGKQKEECKQDDLANQGDQANQTFGGDQANQPFGGDQANQTFGGDQANQTFGGDQGNREMDNQFSSETPPSQVSGLPDEKIVIAGFGSDNLSSLQDQKS